MRMEPSIEMFLEIAQILLISNSSYEITIPHEVLIYMSIVPMFFRYMWHENLVYKYTIIVSSGHFWQKFQPIQQIKKTLFYTRNKK